MRANTMSEIMGLPPVERLRLVEAIIRSVLEEQDYKPLTEREKAILDARLAEDDLDSKSGLTLKQLERSLAKGFQVGLESADSMAIGTAWLDEAERRLDEFKAGKVKGIPCEQVQREARKLLRRKK